MKDATSEMSKTNRILLGLFVGTIIGVFVPLFAINITGKWLSKIGAFGDHLVFGTSCVIAGLIGLKMKKLWVGAFIVWTPIVLFQFFASISSRPLYWWWAAWPAYTRSIGAMILSTLFLAWYRSKVLDES